MKQYFKFLLLVCILSQSSCVKKVNDSNKLAKIQTREEKFEDKFLNKKIVALDKLIPDHNSTKDKILFLYTGFDCQSCIDKGYEIIKKIELLALNCEIYIISSHSNIGRDQERNEYYNYIYNDENELIRRELKFVVTPMILVLNNENIVTKFIFPTTNSDSKHIVNYLTE